MATQANKRPFATNWLPETIILNANDPDRQAVRDSVFDVLCFPTIDYALREASRIRNETIPSIDRELRQLLARKPTPRPTDHPVFNAWDALLSSPEYKEPEVRRLCRLLRNMRAELRRADARVVRMENERIAA